MCASDVRVSCDSHVVIPRAHSQHSCGTGTNVWKTLASLVTSGLQLQDFNVLTGPWKEIDLPSFLFITFLVHEF